MICHGCPTEVWCAYNGKCLSAVNDDMSASQPDPTPQEPAAPTLEQLAKDAARYRKLKAMNPSEIEQIAWVSISPEGFDEMVDQHSGWPPTATPPYK